MDSYAQSFLDICNDEGQAPVWAIEQIFEEHGSDLNEFAETTPEHLLDNGEAILEFIGY